MRFRAASIQRCPSGAVGVASRSFLILLATFAFTIGAFATGTKAGAYSVDVITDPAVVPVGRANLDISIKDTSNKPVSGATVRAIAQMPGMAMGEREQIAVPGKEPGHYSAPAVFGMAGGYEARISISGPGGPATAVVAMETGKTTATSGAADTGLSLMPFVPWIAGVAIVAFVLWRMKKTGQRMSFRAILSGSVLGTLFVFGLVLWGAVYAVNHLRRPGSMTPIEAQVMDMSEPAPEGTAPVTLAVVELRSLNPTVGYSGQAVGNVEIDVNARTTGTIVWMPLYVGSVVKKGDVVARLDTSQLGPDLTEKTAMVESARAGVGVADADYRQSLAMIDQAQAEYGSLQGAVGESKANLLSAREDRNAAVAQVTAAEADLKDAEAKLAASRADQEYWTSELARMTSLLAAGAVTREEFDREKSDSTKSGAARREAEAGVRSSQAKSEAAQAMVRKANAGVVAAQKKIEQSIAALMSHHAHVDTARAQAASARQKIAQAASGVHQAEAGLKGATAAQAYAEIRAETDGIVTQRLLSPGVLVNPGQAILRIAQVSPIRLQANVSEGDLARVRVGDEVTVRPRDATTRSTKARVTSVSPSVDPASRTGVVEAILPNRDRAFMPGQLVTMDIAVGHSATDLVIPYEAIQTEIISGSDAVSTQTRSVVWVASPVSGQPGKYSVERANVVIGDSAGDFVSVKSGLEAGQRVVVSGGTYLKSGASVTDLSGVADSSSSMAPPTLSPSADSHLVSITASGFEPPTLVLLRNGPRRITFLRKTDNTCAKEVVFPDFGIRKPLPLNQPVTIELPAKASGELNYACGMNMLKGKVIAR